MWGSRKTVLHQRGYQLSGVEKNNSHRVRYLDFRESTFGGSTVILGQDLDRRPLYYWDEIKCPRGFAKVLLYSRYTEGEDHVKSYLSPPFVLDTSISDRRDSRSKASFLLVVCTLALESLFLVSGGEVGSRLAAANCEAHKPLVSCVEYLGYFRSIFFLMLLGREEPDPKLTASLL